MDSSTFIASIEKAGESLGAFEVEERGNRQDEEQTEQQGSQEEGGRNPGATCSHRTSTSSTFC